MSHRVPAVFIRPRIQGCEIYASDGLVRLTNVMESSGVHPPPEETMPRLQSVRFVEGLPSSEDVDNLTSDGRHHVIVLDDVMQKVVKSPEMALLFTQGCHHKNLLVVFITQNLFAQGKG